MRSLKKNALTFLVPSCNGSKRIKASLQSITKQNYPKKLIEIVVIDDSSTDNTAEIAREYGARVFRKKFKDAQKSKRFGLDQVTTEYFINVDDDHRLVSKNWINLMLKPLLDDIKIIASFTKFIVNKDDPPISRLLSFDPLQRDPIYMPFTPNINDLIVEQRNGYNLLKYTPEKILPTGQCVWRTRLFQRDFIKKRKKYMELDILSLFVKHGYNLFAYVPQAKTRHVIAKDIKTICRKRIRNIRKNYLYQPEPREFTWFNLKKPQDVLKIILWILYTESLLLSMLNGVRLSVKHKDIAGLWYGPLAFIETNVILFEFLRQFLTALSGKKISFPTK
jgi:glycosyltransferase involved in cell wall biosynthesis